MDTEKIRYNGIGRRDTTDFKAKKIIEYFTGKNRIDVTDKNYASAVKLDKMIYFYNGDEEKDLLKRYYNMKRLFRTIDEFKNEYKKLEKYTDQSGVCYIYNYVIEITEFMSKIENGLSQERKKELLQLEKDGCFDDYPYASYFVKEFIDYKKSPYLKDFLAEKGLYERDFNRFVSIIARLDDNLYDQYLEKESENRLSRQLDVIKKLENIRSGVKTGYTNDGHKFDDVEFYRNLPFYDPDSSRAILDDFGFKKLSAMDQKFRILLDNLCCEDANDIIRYTHSRNILHSNPVPITEEEIMKTGCHINKQDLSENGKKLIIAYMKESNVPFIQGAYVAVRNKYMNEGLVFNSNKTLKK